jgi:excisionase family DNA binding protein
VLITTSTAAERLGVSIRRIQQLITSGRLPAQQMGKFYLVSEGDLKRVADRKVGRPRSATKKKGA